MTVDEIYALISQNIVNAIQNANWCKATLHIQGDNTYVDTTGEYLDEAGDLRSLDVHQFDAEVDFAIMELHEITTAGTYNKWNRAIFRLSPEGSFEMEFVWDQELQHELDQLAE